MSNLSSGLNKFILLCGLALAGATSGCQSARLPVMVTDHGYHHAPAQPTTAVIAAVATASADSVAAPVLPNRFASYQPGPAAAAPDTAVTPRAGSARPGQPDPFTTAVNVTGAVGIAAGAVLAAASSTEASQEPSHLGPVVGMVLGVVLMLVGVVLVFFQGENGRQRLARQARRAARQPAAPVTPDAPAAPAVEGPKRRRRNLKLGLGLLLGGLLLSVAPYLLAGAATTLLAALLQLLALPLLLAGSIVVVLALLTKG